MGLFDKLGAGGGTISLALQSTQAAAGATMRDPITFTGAKRPQTINTLLVRLIRGAGRSDPRDSIKSLDEARVGRTGTAVAARGRMKLTSILFATCAAITAGCLEPAPETDVATGELTATTLAPMCGDGQLEYKKWVCHWGEGWQLDVVGGRDYNCGYPFTGPLWGTTTEGCWTKQLYKCGGGDQDANDDGVPDCWSSSPCPPKPTSYCYVAPPPMTTPGNPPPGGSNGG